MPFAQSPTAVARNPTVTSAVASRAFSLSTACTRTESTSLTARVIAHESQVGGFRYGTARRESPMSVRPCMTYACAPTHSCTRSRGPRGPRSVDSGRACQDDTQPVVAEVNSRATTATRRRETPQRLLSAFLRRLADDSAFQLRRGPPAAETAATRNGPANTSWATALLLLLHRTAAGTVLSRRPRRQLQTLL